MAAKKKKIPVFKNEDEERKFWSTHDSVDYIDWKKAERFSFQKLKPSTQNISLIPPRPKTPRVWPPRYPVIIRRACPPVI